MNIIQHLSNLGEERLTVEAIYLHLRIEQAFKGNLFKHEKLLSEAKQLLEEISSEYFGFLSAVQSKNIKAA